MIALLHSHTSITYHQSKTQRYATKTTSLAVASPFLALSAADLASKEYQLEELEDKEECETELWLNDDGSVTLGKTNGPLFKECKGDWHMIETASEGDRPFRMRLTRSYESPR